MDPAVPIAQAKVQGRSMRDPKDLADLVTELNAYLKGTVPNPNETKRVAALSEAMFRCAHNRLATPGIHDLIIDACMKRIADCPDFGMYTHVRYLFESVLFLDTQREAKKPIVRVGNMDINIPLTILKWAEADRVGVLSSITMCVLASFVAKYHLHAVGRTNDAFKFALETCMNVLKLVKKEDARTSIYAFSCAVYIINSRPKEDARIVDALIQLREPLIALHDTPNLAFSTFYMTKMRDWYPRDERNLRQLAEHAKYEMPVLPTTLNAYDFMSVLGEGAYGTVVRAKYGRDTYAIKMQPTYSECVDSIARERNVMTHMKHECIAHAYAAFMHTDRIACLVLEQSPRGTLMDIVKNEVLTGPYSNQIPSVDAVRNVGNQLMRAVEHIHSLGLHHFDIKPANVLMFYDGRVKLADFGSCLTTAELEIRWFGPHSVDGEGGVNTYGCMFPPESYGRRSRKGSEGVYLAGQDFKMRVDEWGVAYTLYYLCCAYTPYTKDTMRAFLHGQPLPSAQPALVDYLKKWMVDHNGVMERKVEGAITTYEFNKKLDVYLDKERQAFEKRKKDWNLDKNFSERFARNKFKYANVNAYNDEHTARSKAEIDSTKKMLIANIHASVPPYAQLDAALRAVMTLDPRQSSTDALMAWLAPVTSSTMYPNNSTRGYQAYDWNTVGLGKEAWDEELRKMYPLAFEEEESAKRQRVDVHEQKKRKTFGNLNNYEFNELMPDAMWVGLTSNDVLRAIISS